MSHIVEAKTRITCPDLGEFLRLSRQGRPDVVAQLPFIALLRQAVMMVAREHKGTVETYYLDYWGHRYEVNTGLALHIPLPRRERWKNPPSNQSLERGIGLAIDETTGALTFIGDPYLVEEFFQAIQRQIIQKYIALACAASMRLEHYQHVTVHATPESIVVAGEMYAES